MSKNIAKPKGAKDDSANVEFVSYEHGLTVSISGVRGGKQFSENITPADFKARFDIVTEEQKGAA